ncbi:hypothetical protein ACJIZ3_009390 [Penstemon smallii]|uniref:Uncharacterized protein n=1 Tax=Penstemon smallii TaxID=265156 RepID=A0ABD3TCD1_9LAMI
MAHEALVSLNLMIESFLNIPKYRNIFLPIPETEAVHEEVWSLKAILELDHFEGSERLITLKREILKTIPKFRDLLQDHINRCLLLFPESQSLYAGGGSSNELIFSENLEKVTEEMFSFYQTMLKLKVEFYNVKTLETSNKVSPLADLDDALVSLELLTSFLNMSFFNNFILIKEKQLVQGQVYDFKSSIPWHQIHDKEGEIKLNALRGEMLKAIPKFIDVLQDYINKCQLLFSESQSLDDESRSDLIFYQDLEKVRKEMISFLEKTKKIKEEYNAEDLKTSNKESPIGDENFDGNKALYIRGVNDENLQQLINRVMGESRFDIISVMGMAGIGLDPIIIQKIFC